MRKSTAQAAIWALAGAFGACQSPVTITADAGGKPVELSVKVAKPQEGEWLRLFRFDGTDRTQLDSFQLEGGAFKAEVLVGQPAYYTLEVQGNAVSFVLNSAPVAIDVPESGEATVAGGPENDLHQRFQDMNDAMSLEAQGLRKSFYEAASEQEQQQAQEAYIAFIDRSKKSMLALLDEANAIPSVVAISAASMLDPDEDLEAMMRTAKALSDRYPEAPIVKAFSTQIGELAKLAVGQEAPDFALPTAGGQAVQLSSLRGQYVMIDFWASWCKPCRQENPHVVAVYKDFSAKGFQILGVSVDQDHDAWKDAVEKDALPWMHVIDAGEVAQMYQVSAIPFTVLLDKEGRILAKGLRAEALREKLGQLLL